VDLGVIMQHELLPVPVSLANTDGTLRTGQKSIIAEFFTKDVLCPEKVNSTSTLIIDGQALVNALGKPANLSNFADLADKFVQSVYKMGKDLDRLDKVFVRYLNHSIKTGTRCKMKKGSHPIRKLVDSRKFLYHTVGQIF